MSLKQVIEQSNATDWKNKDWYVRAHEYLETMAIHCNMPLEKVAGICASLSPNCQWKQNVTDTYRFIKSKGRARVTTYSTVKAKAILKLRKGQLHKIPEILHGPKIRPFYLALLDPNDASEPVIDTHMIKAYLGNPELNSNGSEVKRISKPNNMIPVQEEVKSLAREYNLNIHSCQAIIWSAWKRITANKVYTNSLPIWNSLVNQVYEQPKLFN